jgi:hypothetical protein
LLDEKPRQRRASRVEGAPVRQRLTRGLDLSQRPKMSALIQTNDTRRSPSLRGALAKKASMSQLRRAIREAPVPRGPLHGPRLLATWMASSQELLGRNKRLFVILAFTRMTTSPEPVALKRVGQRAGVELKERKPFSRSCGRRWREAPDEGFRAVLTRMRLWVTPERPALQTLSRKRGRGACRASRMARPGRATLISPQGSR